MAWENRNGLRYYYRKQRLGGQVTSCYVGTGLAAELHAAAAAEARRILALAWAAEKESRRREMQMARQIDGFAAQVGALLTARLLLDGYHTHRRQWRARRDPIAPTLL